MWKQIRTDRQTDRQDNLFKQKTKKTSKIENLVCTKECVCAPTPIDKGTIRKEERTKERGAIQHDVKTLRENGNEKERERDQWTANEVLVSTLNSFAQGNMVVRSIAQFQ